MAFHKNTRLVETFQKENILLNLILMMLMLFMVYQDKIILIDILLNIIFMLPKKIILILHKIIIKDKTTSLINLHPEASNNKISTSHPTSTQVIFSKIQFSIQSLVKIQSQFMTNHYIEDQD